MGKTAWDVHFGFLIIKMLNLMNLKFPAKIILKFPQKKFAILTSLQKGLLIIKWTSREKVREGVKNLNINDRF